MQREEGKCAHQSVTGPLIFNILVVPGRNLLGSDTHYAFFAVVVLARRAQ